MPASTQNGFSLQQNHGREIATSRQTAKLCVAPSHSRQQIGGPMLGTRCLQRAVTSPKPDVTLMQLFVAVPYQAQFRLETFGVDVGQRRAN